MRILVGILLLTALVLIVPTAAYAAVEGQAVTAFGKEAAKPIKGEAIVATALKYRGVPYKFGGTTSKGFDCSGFVWYVFDLNGVKLPRTADKQFETGKPVAQKDLQPGDVVFFTTYEKGASHCGIYAGNGNFIHASSSHGVTVTPLGDSYWKPRYLGARRLL
ncbi:MAG: C40 family peptidase [Negativicutes bacterium]|nr:C40 family peptidase [Negativicutes bacterium]